MGQDKTQEQTHKGWSRLEEKAAGGIGPGFEKDPRKGTQNPFTSRLKAAEPSAPENSKSQDD